MNAHILRRLAVGLALSMVCLSLSAAAELAGIKLDDSATISGTQLVLNGAGVRTKLGAKVYVAALYLPARTSDADKIINSEAPRRMRLVMKRTVAADKMWGAFRDGIKAPPENGKDGKSL